MIKLLDRVSRKAVTGNAAVKKVILFGILLIKTAAVDNNILVTMHIQNPNSAKSGMTELKSKIQKYSIKLKIFRFLIVLLALGFGILGFKIVSADVPVREQQLEPCDGSKNDTGTCWPVWVHQFDACTEYEKSLEKFIGGVALKTSELEYKAQRRAQQRDIIKAREDVNKLVATVYNELRTQQIATQGEGLDINLRETLQSLGIVVGDTSGDAERNKAGTEEICKAGYYVKAKVGSEGDQCVAVAQEARFITNQDDYIYEEGRRRAMDMMFCYLGDWRHFPIADTNDPANCKQLGLDASCVKDDVWKALGDKLGLTFELGSPTYNTEIHVHNLCEGMRALGLKCAQDELRDFIKYSTIDKIRRKDRTIILAPPQTWYTPARCRIIDSTLPVTGTPFIHKGEKTPYTKDIKSLNVVPDPTKLNVAEFLDYYFGSQFGNPTLPELPSDMDDAEYTIKDEMQAINIPENSFSGLAAKVEQLAGQIIQETTDLRKTQYSAGQGLRDATLRIGWKDYDWAETKNSLEDKGGKTFLEKYEALDSGVKNPDWNPKEPNKIFKPLPCYWENSLAIGCQKPFSGGDASGKTFYFDTGIVISPISITKSKLDSAIKAQFDLAQKAFSDEGGGGGAPGSFNECGISLASPDYSLHSFLPAPWEDTGVNLASAINPLTGDSYITENTPSKDNISYRIPNLPNNYFNVIYNDVFQLYHTSVPDVLAKWFRLNDQKDEKGNDIGMYNSIYGAAGEPIDILEVLGVGGAGPHLDPPGDEAGDEGPPGEPGPLPGGCNQYDNDFNASAKGNKEFSCLLKSIASAESAGCSPKFLKSPAGACGIMQILPLTAGISCQQLIDDPILSIQKAAEYINNRLIPALGGYRAKFGYDIGNSYGQNDKPITPGVNSIYTFDSGNDDLIAAYNAGESAKKTFKRSRDCPDPATPAWQCYNAAEARVLGSYSRETQPYVVRVQHYQDQCMGG